MKHTLATLAAVPLLALGLSGCASGLGSPPLTLSKNVDLSRYAGRWYVIAEIPYFGERGNVAGQVVYTPKPDGSVQDQYFGQKGGFGGKEAYLSFRDTPVPGTHDALWNVHVFWPVTLPYPILYHTPDYSVALVGYPDRSLGWIFSRSPTMSAAEYHRMLGRFAAEGYDTSRFRLIPQYPSQIGKPGFASVPKG